MQCCCAACRLLVPWRGCDDARISRPINSNLSLVNLVLRDYFTKTAHHLSPMASMNNPGAGPLSGVPLRGEFRQIPDEPLMIDCPSRGASLAERTGASQFDTVSISGRVDLVHVLYWS